MRKYSMIILGILVPLCSLTQNKILDSSVISGRFMNEKNEGISNLQVRIIVISAQGDTLYATQILTSNKGGFQTKTPRIENGKVYVSKLSIFYLPFDTTVAMSPKINLGIINLKERVEVLSELIIQKQNIRNSLGKVEYKIDEKQFAKNATAVDVLKQTPLITKDPSGNFLLKGRTIVPVYVDGKLSTQSLVNGLPVELIDKVEVMTVPQITGIEETSGFVNIVTRKTTTSFLKGNINENIGLFRNYNSPSLNLFFKSQKFSATVSGNYLRNQQEVYNTLNRKNISGQTVYEQDLMSEFKLRQYGSLINLFFDPNAKSSFSGQIKFSSIHDISDKMINGQIIGDPDEQTKETNSIRNRRLKNNLFNLDYKRTFNNKSQLTLSTTYSTSGGNRIFTSQTKDSLNKLDDGSYFNEWVLYGIYKFIPHPDSKTSFEIGSIYANRNNHVNYLSQITVPLNGNAAIDPYNTDKYLYHQDLGVVFLNANFTFKNKTSLRIGNRVEYTSNDIRRKHFEEQYFNLVPSVTLFKNLGKPGTLSANFRMYTQRPGLSFINSSRYSDEPSTGYEGNSDLMPEHYSHLEISHSIFLRNKYYLYTSIYLDLGNKLIVDFVKSSGPENPMLVRVFDNIGKKTNPGISVSFNGQLGKSYINLNSYVERMRILAPFIENEGFIFSSSIYLSRSFNHNFSSSLNFFYTNKAVELLYETIKRPYVELSLNKNIFKNKFKVGLTYRDVFSINSKSRIIYFDGVFNQDTRINNNISDCILFISYNFGKKFNFVKRKSIDIPNDLKMANQ